MAEFMGQGTAESYLRVPFPQVCRYIDAAPGKPPYKGLRNFVDSPQLGWILDIQGRAQGLQVCFLVGKEWLDMFV